MEIKDECIDDQEIEILKELYKLPWWKRLWKRDEVDRKIEVYMSKRHRRDLNRRLERIWYGKAEGDRGMKAPMYISPAIYEEIDSGLKGDGDCIPVKSSSI